MSLSTTDFRQACGCFATGVAILTACGPDGTPAGLTINSFVSLSLDPPLVMAAIAHTSGQLSAFDSSESFAVNILSAEQKELSNQFAKPSGTRFQDLGWSKGSNGAPVIAGALAVIECRIERRMDAGDHRVLIGQAIATNVNQLDPLLYFRGGYRSLQS